MAELNEIKLAEDKKPKAKQGKKAAAAREEVPINEIKLAEDKKPKAKQGKKAAAAREEAPINEISRFQTAIKQARNILRREGITGMESFRHICLYITARYITLERVGALGIPPEFAWENLLQVSTTTGGKQKAMDNFFHPTEPCLVAKFDDLFNTRQFAFNVKQLDNHLDLLKLLDGVGMARLECEFDVLGWVYEQHLKTGSAAARDLGQFFTDRFACAYCIELCRPGCSSPGVPETVCDPSAGTAGFLTAFIKYHKRHHPDIDWATHIDKVHGGELDERVAGSACINLFMESGGHVARNMMRKDTLYTDLPQPEYDVILANVPFGVDGLKYASCCPRVQELGIKGTNSEPLFLQLIMLSLKLGGRAAVIVPDGVVVTRSTLHRGTRKYLLDHFELRRVVKMRGKLFTNTNIEPSILFFENTGRPTSQVEFWDLVKDRKGGYKDTLVLSVPREKMDPDALLLDAQSYAVVKARPNPAAYPIVKFMDLYAIPPGVRKFTSGDMDNKGDSPFFSGKWNSPVGTHSEVSFASDAEYFVMIKDGGGDHSSSTVGLGKFFSITGKCSVTSQNSIFVQKEPNEVAHRYVHYWMTLNITALRDKAKYSMTLGHLSAASITDFEILLPPLEVQLEIVATLDRIYAPGAGVLAETLKMTTRAMDLVLVRPDGALLEPLVQAQRLIRDAAQMAAVLKAQMAAVMAAVQARGYPSAKLGEIAVHNNGKTLKSDDKSDDGEYDVMGGGMTYNGKYTKYNREGTTISVSKSGASAGFVAFHTKKYWAGDCFTVEPIDAAACNEKFLYYALKFNFEKYTHGTTIPHCNWRDVERTVVRLPPLEVQLDVVARIEALEMQCAEMKQLQDRSDDNARFILDANLSALPVLEGEEAEKAEEAEEEADEEEEEEE